jgi:hypothetical protein
VIYGVYTQCRRRRRRVNRYFPSGAPGTPPFDAGCRCGSYLRTYLRLARLQISPGRALSLVEDVAGGGPIIYSDEDARRPRYWPIKNPSPRPCSFTIIPLPRFTHRLASSGSRRLPDENRHRREAGYERCEYRCTPSALRASRLGVFAGDERDSTRGVMYFG